MEDEWSPYLFDEFRFAGGVWINFVLNMFW